MRYMKSKANGVVFPFVDHLVADGHADECNKDGKLLGEVAPAPDVTVLETGTGDGKHADSNGDAATGSKPTEAPTISPELTGDELKAKLASMTRDELMAEARAMGLSPHSALGAEKLRTLILKAVSGE